jgi:periplasmic protein TonB
MTRSSLSPFGALLAEIRENPARPDRARDAGAVAPRIVRTAPELDLRIETRVVSAPRRSTSGMARVLWPASVLLHAALLVALVVVPLLRSQALPTPVRETRAFFVAPGSPAVALPPPPPAARATAAPRSTSRPSAQRAPAAPRFSAPTDVSEPVAAAVGDTGLGNPAVADAGLGNPDDNMPRAEAGGVPGGLPGGMPGGIVGGVVASVAVPPPPIVPVRVGGGIKEPRKIRHVDPIYPQVAVAAHVHGNVVLECLVDPQGRVTEVTLVRGVSILNPAAIDAVKQWRYTATLKDGVPVSVILTVTVTFQLS